MTATAEQATDDMMAIFLAAWSPTGWVVDYENVAPANGVDIPPATAVPWASVTIRHVTGNHAAIGGPTGQPRRYNRTGILTVQIFVPAGEGLSEALQLGKVVTDAFEGIVSPLQVWFNNVRMVEIGPDGDWFQVNVLVDFIYDELV